MEEGEEPNDEASARAVSRHCETQPWRCRETGREGDTVQQLLLGAVICIARS